MAPGRRSQDADQGLTTLAGQIELARLVDLSAERLRINIEYDRAVLKDSVTLRLGGGVTNTELWTLTNRLLAARDLTSIRMPGESTLSIVRFADATKLARIEPPETPEPGPPEAVPPRSTPEEVPAGFIRVLHALNHAAPQAVIDAMKDFNAGREGVLRPIPGTNQLIISDLAPRVAQVRDLISTLDVPRSPPRITLVDANYVPAERLATLVTSAANTWATASGSTFKGKVTAGQSEGRVLLVAPADETDFWKSLIASLDLQQEVDTRTYIAPLAVSLQEVVDLIEEAARDPSPRGSGSAWRLVTSELTGTLIITATAHEHERVASLLASLDVTVSEVRSQVRSFRVRNRKAADLVQVILGTLELGVPAEPLMPAIARDVPRDGEQARSVSTRDLTSELVLTIDDETNTLIAAGPARLVERVGALIQDVDVRQPQVMLEALVLSLSEGDTFDLGVELQKLEVSGQTLMRFVSLFGLSSVSVDDASTALAGTGFGGVVLNPGDFAVVLQALQTLNQGRSLNLPKVLVNNNAQAALDSVVQQPFTSTNASDTVATTSFGGFENAGTSINVTPRIAPGDHLVLEYTISLSAFVGESSSPSIPPPRQQNTLQSEVTIPDGYTVVLGGLEIATQAEAISQVPLLGSIPGVGELFKSRSRSMSHSRFFVFIRANILRRDGFEDLKYLSEVSGRDAHLQNAGTALTTANGVTGWPEVKPRIIR